MGISGPILTFLAGAIFDKVDYNKNGVIEDVEVEVAILQLYHQINSRLPGVQQPPSREKIRKALLAFDSNRDGVLDRKEFVGFVQNIVTLGPDKFLKNVVVNTGVLPAAAVAFKKLSGTGLANYIPAMAQMAGIPPVVLAPLMGVITKTVTGLIPM